MTRSLKEETGRVLFAAVAVWATVVAAGTVEGLFGKFDAQSIAAFAAAASAYALAVYRLDPNLRVFAASAGARWSWMAFAVSLGIVAVGTIAGWPALAVFGAPLATVTFVAALDAAARPRKARAKSPGATPAAT